MSERNTSRPDHLRLVGGNEIERQRRDLQALGHRAVLLRNELASAAMEADRILRTIATELAERDLNLEAS